jgi:NAD(P)-dependent dehydrogenase (short-subunit alcohol dehydrogenase family)
LFKEKNVLITGGGAGIGAALAIEFARLGAQVIVADLKMGKTSQTAPATPVAEAVVVDVSSVTEVQALIGYISQKYGHLDVLVNCAGIIDGGEMLEIPFDTWQRVMSVNLWGTINMSLAAYSLMRERNTGIIVNMGSASTFLGAPLLGPYVLSKGGVYEFSKLLAIEAEASGIRVCVVCPGNVDTPMIRGRHVSGFTPAISAEDAAGRIMKGLAKRTRVIVFPFYAKVFWYLDRLSPMLLNPLRRRILQRARRRRPDA